MTDQHTRYRLHDRPLLTIPAVRAILSTWTEDMRSLAYQPSELPPSPGSDTRLDIWGFVFAIDGLRDNERAISALLDRVDEFHVRPSYDAIFAMAGLLLAMKKEIRQVVNDHAQQEVRVRKCRFVRGN